MRGKSGGEVALPLFGDMEAIGKLVQSRLLQHHHQSHRELKDDGEEDELDRVKSEVNNDDSIIERDEKPREGEVDGGGGNSDSSSRPSLGGTFSIDSLLR